VRRLLVHPLPLRARLRRRRLAARRRAARRAARLALDEAVAARVVVAHLPHRAQVDVPLEVDLDARRVRLPRRLERRGLRDRKLAPRAARRVDRPQPARRRRRRARRSACIVR